MLKKLQQAFIGAQSFLKRSDAPAELDAGAAYDNEAVLIDLPRPISNDRFKRLSARNGCHEYLLQTNEGKQYILQKSLPADLVSLRNEIRPLYAIGDSLMVLGQPARVVAADIGLPAVSLMRSTAAGVSAIDFGMGIGAAIYASLSGLSPESLQTLTVWLGVSKATQAGVAYGLSQQLQQTPETLQKLGKVLPVEDQSTTPAK